MGFPLFLVYLVFVFLRPTDRFPILASYPVMTGLAVLALLAAFARVLMGGGPSFRAPQIPLVIAFLSWAAFSVAAADRWPGGALLAFQELQPKAVLFFMIILNLDSMRRLRVVAALLVVLLVIIVTEGVMAYHYGYGGDKFVLTQSDEQAGVVSGGPDASYDSPSTGVMRVRGLGELSDPNDLAQTIVATLPFLLLAWRRGRWLRNAAVVWIPTTMLLYGLYLTRSRGGMLALLIVLFAVFRRRLGRVTSLAVAGLGAVALVALGFAGGRTMGMDESASSRIDAWADGIQMLKSSPVWGVGYGNFIDHHHLIAHNSFVHCFAELGLVGYFIWLGILVITLAQIAAVARLVSEEPFASWARTQQLSLTGFLAAAWFLSRTYSTLLFVLIALATAVIDLARRERFSVRALDLGSWTVVVCLLEAVTIGIVYVTVRLAG